MNPTLQISTAIHDRFPHFLLYWFAAKYGTDAVAKLPVTHLIAETTEVLTKACVAAHDVPTHPLIRPWREAFRAQNVKASEYRSSAEALFRRFAATKYSATGIPMVDTYNAISAKHTAPMGAYDLHSLPTQNMVVRFAAAGDRYTPLGGDPTHFPINDRIPVYAAGEEILCWCFNHRDSANTCVRQTTTEIVVIAEAIAASQYSAARTAIEEMRIVLQQIGANVTDVVEVRG